MKSNERTIHWLIFSLRLLGVSIICQFFCFYLLMRMARVKNFFSSAFIARSIGNHSRGTESDISNPFLFTEEMSIAIENSGKSAHSLPKPVILFIMPKCLLNKRQQALIVRIFLLRHRLPTTLIVRRIATPSILFYREQACKHLCPLLSFFRDALQVLHRKCTTIFYD